MFGLGCHETHFLRKKRNSLLDIDASRSEFIGNSLKMYIPFGPTIVYSLYEQLPFHSLLVHGLTTVDTCQLDTRVFLSKG